MDHGRKLNGTGHEMVHPHPKHLPMHMFFYWSAQAEVLFDGWPQPKYGAGMYVVSLVLVFVLAVATEWFSHCRVMKPGSTGLVAGLVQSVLYTVRCVLSYMVMLAVMCYNTGVFLAGVVGFGVGFFIFGSRTFRNKPEKPSDLPPMTCC